MARQAVTRAFGVVYAPHIFVFDRDRKLRYEGRIDDNLREDAVQSSDARNAIDAVLAGKPAPLARTRVSGCRVKGLDGAANASQAQAEADKGDVPLTMAGAEDLKKLRQNGTGKLLLVNPAIGARRAREFPDLEATHACTVRAISFVSVSVNDPEERAAVRSSSRNTARPTTTASSPPRTSTDSRRRSTRTCPRRCRTRCCWGRAARSGIRSWASSTR